MKDESVGDDEIAETKIEAKSKTVANFPSFGSKVQRELKLIDEKKINLPGPGAY